MRDHTLSHGQSVGFGAPRAQALASRPGYKFALITIETRLKPLRLEPLLSSGFVFHLNISTNKLAPPSNMAPGGITPASHTTTSNGYREAHLWGCLIPCSSTDLPRLDLWRYSPTYKIGRAEDNDIILPGFRISNEHAVITWAGPQGRRVAHASTDMGVQIKDTSSNGTWVCGIIRSML